MTPAQQLAQALPSQPKRRKYGNRPTVVDNIRFDSAKEAARWSALQLLARAGEITDLERQVTYQLDVNGVHIAAYRCDFQYCERGELVVEDVKSPPTRAEPSYRQKARLMRAVHGITIREV